MHLPPAGGAGAPREVGCVKNRPQRAMPGNGLRRGGCAGVGEGAVCCIQVWTCPHLTPDRACAGVGEGAVCCTTDPAKFVAYLRAEFGDKAVDLETAPPDGRALNGANQHTGPREDSGNGCPNPSGASDRKMKNLRAILRAPEVVQDLYRETAGAEPSPSDRSRPACPWDRTICARVPASRSRPVGRPKAAARGGRAKGKAAKGLRGATVATLVRAVGE